jgi:hypothetical protein
MGWLMLVTLPAGAFMFVLWLIVLIFHRANWRRRKWIKTSYAATL